jgi:hypothetical protein
MSFLSRPPPEEILDRITDLHAQYRQPWLADNWWQMEASAHAPPIISLSPMGPQHLDKHGNFPIEPVGQFGVKMKWEGKEVYVGDFKEGAKHGKGIFVRSNGDKHVGHYQGGIAHGKGVYHWKNGDTWVGSWFHGRQVMVLRVFFDSPWPFVCMHAARSRVAKQPCAPSPGTN